MPPASGQRIASLDVLRGLAVLGIFLINIIGMGAVLEAADYPGHDGGPALGWDAHDQLLWWVSQLFVEGTMRGLFTLLFGAGFILFCAREVTSSGRTDVGRLFLRRSALLLCFGVFNALVLFWPGDILLIYGCAGFLLFPFRRMRPRRLMVAGGILLVALSCWSLAQALEDCSAALASTEVIVTLPGTTVLDRIDHETWAQEVAARHGGLGTNAQYFASLFWSWLWDLDTVWWIFDALALMLVGAALLRLEIITGARSAAFYLRMALAGYGIGLTLNFLEASALVNSGFSPTVAWPEASYQASRLATTLGHLGLVLLLLKRGVWMKFLAALAQTGRMALTNYLGQSAIAAVLFSGFGFGLYASLDRGQLWGIAAAVWVFQVASSHAWLLHFRMGPAEWLWRTLTYGAAPPLRNTPHQGLLG